MPREALSERDGAAWCLARLDANLIGLGAPPIHRQPVRRQRTRNSLLDAWWAHEVKHVTDEMRRLEAAIK